MGDAALCDVSGLQVLDTAIALGKAAKSESGGIKGMGLEGGIKIGLMGLTAVNPVIGGIASGVFAGAKALGVNFGGTSLANWNRSLGRFYRAGMPLQLGQRIYRLMQSSDPTGSKTWEIIVDTLGVPTEKGGTKKGFTRGAPIPVRDDSELIPWMNAVKQG